MPNYLNVRDYAAGNGSTDDTAAMQRTLSAFASAANRTDVFVPTGIYRITGELVLTQCRGGRIIGTGNTGGQVAQGEPGYANRQVGTTLLWAGANGGTMFKLLGSSAATLDGLTLLGTSTPLYGFSTSTSSGPSSSQLRFNNAAPSGTTTIYVSDISSEGIDMGWWLDELASGTTPRLTILDLISTATATFGITAVVVSAGYRTITVSHVSSSGTFGNGNPISLTIRKNSIRERAGVLLQQKSDGGGGFPAGHTLMQNCLLRDAEVGLQLDDVAVGTNCADNTIVHCSFADCAAGIKAKSNQVLNNEVINCDFNRCDVGIDHERGGDLRVFGGSMNGEGTGGVFLKIRGGGSNASSFILSGIRLEISGTTGIPSLLDAGYPSGSTSSGPQNVLIDGFSWSGGGTPSTAPLLTIGSWCNVTMRGCYIKGNLAVITAEPSRNSTLRIEHCRFAGYTPAQLITLIAEGFWKTVDCTDGDGTPIDDDGNWPPQLIAGAGLTLTGKTLAVGAGTGIVANANDVALTGNALALHNLTSAANKGIYFTGSGTAGTFDLSAGGRAIGGLSIATGNVIYGTGTDTVAAGTPDAAGLVAKSGNQTGIAGDKTWTGAQTINSILTVTGDLYPARVLSDGVIAAGVATLTIDTGTVDVDAQAANAFNLTLTSSVTINSPANPLADGQIIRFRIRQNGTGNWTLAWGTAFRFTGGASPGHTLTPNKTDHYVFEYVSADSKWDMIAEKLNF